MAILDHFGSCRFLTGLVGRIDVTSHGWCRLVPSRGAQWQWALFLLSDLQDAKLYPNQARNHGGCSFPWWLGGCCGWSIICYMMYYYVILTCLAENIINHPHTVSIFWIRSSTQGRHMSPFHGIWRALSRKVTYAAAISACEKGEGIRTMGRVMGTMKIWCARIGIYM
jgi:hypothetical protein